MFVVSVDVGLVVTFSKWGFFTSTGTGSAAGLFFIKLDEIVDATLDVLVPCPGSEKYLDVLYAVTIRH